MDKTFCWRDLFRREHVINRLNDGPFQPYLDGFATALVEQRYGRNTIRRAICAADHFGRWLLDQRLDWAEAHETTVLRYYNLLGRCEAGDWPHRLKGLNLAVGFLDRAGIIYRSKAIISPATPVEQWLGEFDSRGSSHIQPKTSVKDWWLTLQAVCGVDPDRSGIVQTD